MILSHIEKFSSNVAFIDNINNKNNEIRYLEILKLNKEIINFIKKKSLIFIISENTIGSLMGYASLTMLDSLLVPVSHDITYDNFEILRKKYKPQYLWCEESFLNKKIKNFFSPVFKYKDYRLYKAKIKKNLIIDKQLKFLLSTSGSLGEPKCVKLSFENIKNNSNAIDKYLKINKLDRTITTLPWNYSYGLSIINTHLNKGASLVVTKKTLFDKEFWELYDKSKITNFNGVPFTFEILKKIKLERLFNSKIRFITQAGGKMNSILSNEIVKLCIENKILFYSMYGQTEASPRMSYVEKTFKRTKSSCIGKPINGGKFYLVDEKNKKIKKPQTSGELIYKGKNVFIGYSENYKDLKKSCLKNYTLKTGDLAKFDFEGNYYLVGRKSRFVKIFGIRISLETIEEKLKLNNIDCAAITKDENLFIFIEKINKQKKMQQIISKIIKITINDFCLKYISSFPRNENNKISYKTLIKMATK